MTSNTNRLDGAMMTDELLPCPHCGAIAQVVEGQGPFEGRAQVECSACRISTFWYDEAVVRNQWNRRALLSARKPAEQSVPADLLPNALWTRHGSGSFEWWSFKGYEARKDGADQWVLRKAGEELYRHTHLQVAMAHAERALLAAAPAAPAQSPSLIGWWDSAEASGFRWKEGIVRSDFSNGTPIYANAAPPAQSGEPVDDSEIARRLTAAGIKTQYLTQAVTRRELWLTDGSIDVRKFAHAVLSTPQSSQPVEAGEAKRFPTPISISTDKICEIASKYNLGNPRLDALRGFVNEVILVNEAEYAKSE